MTQREEKEKQHHIFNGCISKCDLISLIESFTYHDGPISIDLLNFVKDSVKMTKKELQENLNYYREQCTH